MNNHIKWQLFDRSALYVAYCVTIGIIVACGTWVGNPKPKDGSGGDGGGTNNTTVAASGGGTQSALTLAPGDVLLRRFNLKSGTLFTTTLSLKAGVALVDGASSSTSGTQTSVTTSIATTSSTSVATSAAVEVSVANPNGIEAAYGRGSTAATTASITPASDGTFTVLFKNNTNEPQTVAAATASGADSATDPVNASQRNGSGTNAILLKAVIAFARECKVYANNAATVRTITAPNDEYFAQPFVFIGKVGVDKKVTPITTATITLSSGNTVLSLKRLSDLPTASYNMISSQVDSERYNYVRQFYQGYFGAAGEMYTTDYFRFGGDCDHAPTFKLGADVGATVVKLAIVDASQSPPLQTDYRIQPTIGPAFTMYTSQGQKMTDWTQCGYDRITGEPTTYNGDAAVCKNLSFSDPPYVTLDYKLPSAQDPKVYSAASDPTRVIYYGYSSPKSWLKSLASNFDGLASGSKVTLDLNSCFNNGGLVSIPLSTQQNVMPLAELNASEGDVISLARRSGSYTALPDFYQGNIDASGAFDYATCIPSKTSSCGIWATVNVNVKKCSIKADSGIYAASVGQSFIYPEYFDMSGIIVK